jgi:hypothetical protein
MDAMLRAREVVACRSWSTSQEPTSEHWWADVLADPRARIRRRQRSFDGRYGRRTAEDSYYRLADEPSPVIEVACSKCEWKAAFSRVELLAIYGAESPGCAYRCKRRAPLELGALVAALPEHYLRPAS